MIDFTFSKRQRVYLIFKRLFDIFFSVFLIILLSPIFIFTAFLVKIDSKGPIIFKQKRPGKEKKIYTIYKFRTMKIETILFDKVLSDKERVTKIGSLLRRTSIDELPQLWNILKGEMSFIGPRPFLINDLGTYTKDQEVRFKLLPGISSWTAVNGRNSLSIQEKYNLEIDYTKNISFLLDLKILIKTITLIISGKNVIDEINKPRIAAHIKEYLDNTNE